MKHLLNIFMTFCIVATMLGVNSCDCKYDKDFDLNKVKLDITMPAFRSQAELMNAQLTVIDQNSKKELKFTDLNNIKLKTGLYTFIFSGLLQNGIKKANCTGMVQGVEITSNNQLVKLKMDITSDARNFVIEEIFFASTDNGSSSPIDYTHDQYIKITNNSDEVLYADSLLIMQSAFNTVKNDKITPEGFIQQGFATDMIYMIPGSGKDHPVKPGESIIVCDQGLNFKKNLKDGVDLSKANFEWYDSNVQAPFSPDIDTDVPNLIPVYNSYSFGFWKINQNGLNAIAIAKIKGDLKTYLDKNKQSYSFIRVLPNGMQFPVKGSAYILKDNNVLDAVNLSVVSNYERQATPNSMDSGYTYCSKVDTDPGYGTSVIRKVDEKLTKELGHKVLVDSNNSTNDFLPNQLSSYLIHE